MGLRQPGQPQQPKQQLPEYEAMRRRTQQRLESEGQGQQEALQRRFAQVGNLNSGAAIKNEQALQGQIATQKEDALGQIDAQEMGEQQRRQEVQDQMAFQSGEAQKGRDFQGGMFNQEFGLKNQAFDEEKRARGFQEKLASADFDRDSNTLNKTWAQAIQAGGDPEGMTNILRGIDEGKYGGGYSSLNGPTADQTAALARAASATPRENIGAEVGNINEMVKIDKSRPVMFGKWKSQLKAAGFSDAAVQAAFAAKGIKI